MNRSKVGKSILFILPVVAGAVILVILFGVNQLATAKTCKGVISSLTCLNKVQALDNNLPLPPLPEFQESLEFEQFATVATRITVDGMFSDEPESKRPAHRYSRRQAWNADETLIDLTIGLVDAQDQSVFMNGVPLTAERSWSHSNPDWMYGVRSDPKPNQFGLLDVRTKTFKLIQKFDAYESCSIGAGEGNLSWDDQYVVLACANEDGDTDLISYDVQNGVTLGILKAKPDFNWASFTPSGRHIIVENNPAGNDLNELENLVRYEPDFSAEHVLTYDRNHGDLGVDTSGRDVFVMLDWYRVSYIEIETGRRIRLGVANRRHFPGHGHVSCQNYLRPGWCYISGGETSIIGAVKIEEQNGIISSAKSLLTSGPTAGVSEFEPWGFHYSTHDSYESNSKASASASGRQVIFTSDWGLPGQTHDYVIRPRNDNN